MRQVNVWDRNNCELRPTGCLFLLCEIFLFSIKLSNVIFWHSWKFACLARMRALPQVPGRFGSGVTDNKGEDVFASHSPTAADNDGSAGRQFWEELGKARKTSKKSNGSHWTYFPSKARGYFDGFTIKISR